MRLTDKQIQTIKKERSIVGWETLQNIFDTIEEQQVEIDLLRGELKLQYECVGILARKVEQLDLKNALMQVILEENGLADKNGLTLVKKQEVTHDDNAK